MKANRYFFYVIALVLGPFVLITDFYPFLRQGMFAEPAKQVKIYERFFFETKSLKGWQELKADEQQLPLSQMLYLARNYYYRNETAKLMKVIGNTYAKGSDIRLVRDSGFGKTVVDSLKAEL